MPRTHASWISSESHYFTFVPQPWLPRTWVRGTRAKVVTYPLMKKTQNVEELQAIARTTRRQIIEMITAAKSGHPGGSLSAVEILVTLYFDVMNHDPANPKWADR